MEMVKNIKEHTEVTKEMIFVVSGGLIFYAYSDDVEGLTKYGDIDSVITIKRAFTVDTQLTLVPSRMAGGMSVAPVNIVAEFRDMKLRYSGYGKVPENSGIAKSIREMTTGIVS